MTIVKTVASIIPLIIFVSVISGYLRTAIRVVDVSQSVMSGDTEEATSTIANFTETEVREEVEGVVWDISLAIISKFVVIFTPIVAVVLALFGKMMR